MLLVVGLTELRVLVVEDEPLVAMLAEEMLSDLGHRAALVAYSLQDGLAALETGDFDLAFLDVNLGGSLSFPIAEAATKRGMPVLFVTGFGIQHMEQLDGQCVLPKPYSSQDLERAISKAMNRGPVRG